MICATSQMKSGCLSLFERLAAPTTTSTHKQCCGSAADRDPASWVNADPDPGIWWAKIVKFLLKKMIFYRLKIAIFFPRTLGRPSKAIQDKPKEKSSTLKRNFSSLFSFLDNFAHLDKNPDPADQNQWGSWIADPDFQYCTQVKCLLYKKVRRMWIMANCLWFGENFLVFIGNKWSNIFENFGGTSRCSEKIYLANSKIFAEFPTSKLCHLPNAEEK